MFKSNVPGLSYVSWDSCSIVYNNNSYIIQNSYTCKKYIYWNSLNPYAFQTSDRLLDETGDRYLVCINDKGIYSEPPLSDKIQLIFSEETGNPDLVATQISSFHEMFDETGEKVAAIQKDIDGVISTVSEVKTSNEEVVKKVTVLEQTSEILSGEISKISTEFNDSKESSELRDNTNKALLSLNSVIGAFSTSMTSYVEDNKISDSEKIDIDNYKSNLEIQKTNVNAQVNLILANLQQNGETNKYNTLNSKKEDFNQALDVLNTIIDNAIVDKVITPTEIVNITSAFGKVNTESLELKNTLDEIVMLGSSGVMVEELAKISATSNNITLSVSKIEQSLKNNLNINKSNLQTQIEDLYTAIDNLTFTINTSIEDREISTDEKTNIENDLQLVDNEFNDIASKYEEIKNNANLSEVSKTALINSYNNLSTLKQEYSNAITNAIKDGLINDTEINNMELTNLNFTNEINTLHQLMSRCLDEIEKKEWEVSLQETKDAYNKEIEELNNRLNNAIFNVGDAINSGLVDSIEKESMLNDLSQLEIQKNIIDERFNKWYNDPFLLGDNKVNYKTEYDNLTKKYLILVDLINSIANSSTLVSETDKENVENSKREFSQALSNFYFTSDKVINIISVNESEYLNNNLRQELIDGNNAINSLEDTLNNSFKDGIINEIELSNINIILTQIEKEKEDIEKNFNEIYNNPNLK